MLLQRWQKALRMISRLNSTSANADPIKDEVTNGIDGEIPNNQTENTPSNEDFTKRNIPKPFLDPDLLNHRYRHLIATDAHDVMFNNPSYIDDVDWSSRWPASAPFNPHLVALPIRMGFPQNKCVTPDKYSNLELMKVQNFLHLTPPAIKKHCDAIKHLCTSFPEELKSDEACEKAFPLETHTVDYLASGNTAKDDRSQFVTKTIRLCNLVLDAHARKKIIDLLGKRYDRKTDIVKIKVGRCPARKQNRDFIDYILTALYFEGWQKEKWESREFIDDYDGQYWWEDSVSHRNLKTVLEHDQRDVNMDKNPDVKAYRNAVSDLKLEPKPEELGEMTGARNKAIENYKNSVLKLLNLSPK